MTRTKVLITAGIMPLIIAMLLAFIPLGNQPVASANAALFGLTLTPTPLPTDTPIPPTNTPIPPTDTPVPQPTRKPSEPAATSIPPTLTPTPPPILPVSGGGGSQVWALWALGLTALLCGVLLRGWSRLRGARKI